MGRPARAGPGLSAGGPGGPARARVPLSRRRARPPRRRAARVARHGHARVARPGRRRARGPARPPGRRLVQRARGTAVGPGGRHAVRRPPAAPAAEGAMSVVRAVAHVHSIWSDDGAWSLEDLAVAFRRRGVRVVLMAEHSRGWTAERYARYLAACEAASMEDVLLVPGIEYNDADNVVHVPVWGDLPFLGAEPDIGRLLAEADAAGATSVFAHPWRRDAWRRFEPSWGRHLTAVEVWNRKYDGWAPDARAMQLAERAGLPVFVSLDFHTARQFFPLRMALALADAEPVDRDAVYAALRARRFVPLAFGRRAEALAGEPRRSALRAGEHARRVAAPGLRLVTG